MCYSTLFSLSSENNSKTMHDKPHFDKCLSTKCILIKIIILYFCVQLWLCEFLILQTILSMYRSLDFLTIFIESSFFPGIIIQLFLFPVELLRVFFCNCCRRCLHNPADGDISRLILNINIFSYSLLNKHQHWPLGVSASEWIKCPGKREIYCDISVFRCELFRLFISLFYVFHLSSFIYIRFPRFNFRISLVLIE